MVLKHDVRREQYNWKITSRSSTFTGFEGNYHGDLSNLVTRSPSLSSPLLLLSFMEEENDYSILEVGLKQTAKG